MSDYYVRVNVDLACGCGWTTAIECPEGPDEPRPETILGALGISLRNPALLAMLASDMHVNRGYEAIDIKVRVKVGDVPEELPDE